jgi:two-component system response regulator HydG
MMRNILVICHDSEVSSLIKSKTHQSATIRYAADLSTAFQFSNRKFNLVFLDISLVPDSFTDEFKKIIRHFRGGDTSVKVVALSPKEKVRRAVEAVRQGADDYLTYPIDGAEIDLVFEHVQHNISKQLELEYLRDQFWKADWLDIIHTYNPLMRKVFEKFRSVAPTIVTVLLLGETGTGKGLMARLIHLHSNRKEGPFIEIHCGAVPDTLIESELFGHEKGAFTGADQRKIGRFEMAQNGTIFLDEIGTITPAVQIKLLQVLQDGTFNRVGGTDQLHADARIIAATNANLEGMANSGSFRKDLFYRLNIFPIELPPLIERMEDLPHLVVLFLDKLNKKYGKNIDGIEPGLIEAMQTYNWPGNLRELENVLERAYILETSHHLSPESFPERLIIGSKIIQTMNTTDQLPLAEARQIAIDAFERNYLSKLLVKHNGRINWSAKEAQITTRQLSRLVTKHGLDKDRYKH